MTKTCEKHSSRSCSLLRPTSGKVQLSGFYRIYLGTREGQKIWIVDGEKVCLELYPDFIMGGNDQRYRFNPVNDSWIDNRIGIEELEYTIAHELIERKLMREKGWTYERAHIEGGLAIEKEMREKDARLVEARMRKLRTSKSALPAVYRGFVGTTGGAKIWIVDGPLVRKDLDGDFCFGSNDLCAKYIPAKEIWLDSAMSVEEAYYALLHQKVDRSRREDGIKHAYDCALMAALDERRRQAALRERHEAQLAMVNLGVRDKGKRVRKRKGK